MPDNLQREQRLWGPESVTSAAHLRSVIIL